MKHQRKRSLENQKARSPSANRRIAKRHNSKNKKRLSASEKLARRIEHWHKRLAPQFPDIDPHDLDLIIAALLRTPEERMKVMFQASMFFDQGLLAELIDAVAQAGLQVILIGNAAAIVYNAPVLTPNVDLMVRDHPQLQKKLQKFAQIYGVALIRPYEPMPQVIRAVGRPVQVNFVLKLSSGESFESIPSRATKYRLGRHTVWVASPEDIIAAKEAAGRPKDKAALPILKEALQVHKAAAKERRSSKCTL